MHDNRHARSPVIITTALHGTRIAHIFFRFCALTCNGVSPWTFARHLGHQYLLQTAEVIPRHLTPPPRCSRRQAEACCMAQIARAFWRVDGKSALTSTKHSAPRVPEQACGTDATLSQSPEHGPGVRCRAIHVAGFGASQFRGSVQVNSAVRPCCTGCTNGTTSGYKSLAARDWGPMGTHNLGDDALLRFVTPPYTTGLIKGRS